MNWIAEGIVYFEMLLFVSGTDPAGQKGYQLISLEEPLTLCQRAANNSGFVETILQSIPERVIDTGVYSQSSLERRFDSVYDECRKAALFPTATKLLPQFLSNIYSKLVYDGAPRYTNELQFCSAEGMSTKDLLVQAKYFMDKHCLGCAVKCVVQLEGVPRTLAQDWLDEARLFLEVKQAADALYSYALTKSMGLVI